MDELTKWKREREETGSKDHCQQQYRSSSNYN